MCIKHIYLHRNEHNLVIMKMKWILTNQNKLCLNYRIFSIKELHIILIFMRYLLFWLPTFKMWNGKKKSLLKNREHVIVMSIYMTNWYCTKMVSVYLNSKSCLPSNNNDFSWLHRIDKWSSAGHIDYFTQLNRKAV